MTGLRRAVSILGVAVAGMLAAGASGANGENVPSADAVKVVEHPVPIDARKVATAAPIGTPEPGTFAAGLIGAGFVAGLTFRRGLLRRKDGLV